MEKRILYDSRATWIVPSFMWRSSASLQRAAGVLGSVRLNTEVINGVALSSCHIPSCLQGRTTVVYTLCAAVHSHMMWAVSGNLTSVLCSCEQLCFSATASQLESLFALILNSNRHS